MRGEQFRAIGSGLLFLACCGILALTLIAAFIGYVTVGVWFA